LTYQSVDLRVLSYK